MILNEYGEIAENELLNSEEFRSNVEIDHYVIMPNHVHVIIIIRNNYCRGTTRCAATTEAIDKPVKGSLPTIIRAFKTAVTKQINTLSKLFTFSYSRLLYFLFINYF